MRMIVIVYDVRFRKIRLYPAMPTCFGADRFKNGKFFGRAAPPSQID